MPHGAARLDFPCAGDRITAIRRPGVILLGGLTIFTLFAVAEDRRLLWSNELHLWCPGAYWHVLILRCPPWLLAAMFAVPIIAGAMGIHLAIEKPLLRAIRPGKNTGPIRPSSALV